MLSNSKNVKTAIMLLTDASAVFCWLGYGLPSILFPTLNMKVHCFEYEGIHCLRGNYSKLIQQHMEVSTVASCNNNVLSPVTYASLH